jgi:hypothetical protein
MSDGLTSALSACGQPRAGSTMEAPCAAVIVNADDWGRDALTTDRSLECILRGTVSSVSAMIFMEDSERAAGLARLHGVDAGLHLNFTLPFSATVCSSRLLEHQKQLSRFLTSHRLAPVLYHPRLAQSFEYVAKAQMDEYERLYGVSANRMDGHHHMHLCANVIKQKLLPQGIVVRRNLSFGPGEKGYVNRLYRSRQDRRLIRRHRTTDLFFDLLPIEPHQRLTRIIGLADRFDIEIETHPIRDNEYHFLVGGGIAQCAKNAAIAHGYILRSRNSCSDARAIPCVKQAWR